MLTPLPGATPMKAGSAVSCIDVCLSNLLLSVAL